MSEPFEWKDEHLARDVKCPCGWVGWTGQLIVKDRLRCPKCDRALERASVVKP
jgi:hypothetical protein